MYNVSHLYFLKIFFCSVILLSLSLSLSLSPSLFIPLFVPLSVCLSVCQLQNQGKCQKKKLFNLDTFEHFSLFCSLKRGQVKTQCQLEFAERKNEFPIQKASVIFKRNALTSSRLIWKMENRYF